MIVAETQRVRRLVGRLERGADVLECCARICREHNVRSGELRATGTLEDVELFDVNARTRGVHPPHRFPSVFNIIHLSGSIGEVDGKLHLEATCALSREGDNGIELLGGRLGRARVHAAEFVIESYEDLLLRRSIDPATGLLLCSDAIALAPAPAAAGPGGRSQGASPAGGVPSRRAEPAAAPVAVASAIEFEARASGRVAPRGTPHTDSGATRLVTAPPAGPDWEAVARSSADAGPVPVEEESDDPLQAGDVIAHPRFGLCQVERIEGANEYAQVRLPNKRLIRLSLEVIRLIRDGLDDSGNRKYKVVVAR